VDGVRAVQRGNRIAENVRVGVVYAVDLQRRHVPRIDKGAQVGRLVAKVSGTVFRKRNRDGAGRATNALCHYIAGGNTKYCCQHDQQGGDRKGKTSYFHNQYSLFE
jgi:hypothetical protein